VDAAAESEASSHTMQRRGVGLLGLLAMLAARADAPHPAPPPVPDPPPATNQTCEHINGAPINQKRCGCVKGIRMGAHYGPACNPNDKACKLGDAIAAARVNTIGDCCAMCGNYRGPPYDSQRCGCWEFTDDPKCWNSNHCSNCILRHSCAPNTTDSRYFSGVFDWHYPPGPPPPAP